MGRLRRPARSLSSPRALAYRAMRLLVLMIVGAAILAPLAVLASTAFKGDGEIYDFPMRLVPKSPTLDNFARLADRFPLYILNSAKLTTILVLVQLLTSTTGAYAFSKLKWRGRDSVFAIYVMSIMIPIQAVIIPQFLIVKNLGLYDSHWALVLTGSFTAFGTFLVKQYFMTVPDSFIEAARIDGASELRIFLGIMVPLAKPAIATQVIFSFRYFWNDFFSPLIYLTAQGLKTLPLGMADFATENYVYLGPQMAASLISIIPVMIIFLAAQRYFVEGVAATGVKG
jgi:multiple sugar transport system permease protein